ncbi:MAG: energy-coupling factor transporter ATPase [Ruminococcaceae bacterium]|mgnify:CR=1 FL=1|nr:energy-coupling factor transporter ATPase [Oscillospiraceae bacterium]
MDTILEFKNVSFSYDDDGNKAVSNLSFTIKKGEFVAVLGHNGSGKSTLAKLSNAILIPDEGQVLAMGIDTADETRTLEIRQHIGMVFQNPDNQIVATIVEEDVAFGPENLGVPPEEIRIRVDKALKAVGMYDFRDHEPHKLSGGQKQRVAIAGIIAMQPDCIVLDEATAMLDPNGRKEVIKTIKYLHEEYGITVVFITHYMDEAALADRIIVMNDGEILFDDHPLEVFHHGKELREVGLDVPQATEFAIALNMKRKVLTTEDALEGLIGILEKGSSEG